MRGDNVNKDRTDRGEESLSARCAPLRPAQSRTRALCGPGHCLGKAGTGPLWLAAGRPGGSAPWSASTTGSTGLERGKET